MTGGSIADIFNSQARTGRRLCLVTANNAISVTIKKGIATQLGSSGTVGEGMGVCKAELGLTYLAYMIGAVQE